MADPIAGTSPSQITGIARPVGVGQLDLPLRVRRNLVQGAVQRDLLARSPSAVVGTWEAGPWTTVASAPVVDIPGPGDHFPLPADGPVEVMSSSADDAAPAGIGATSIIVSGTAPGGGTVDPVLPDSGTDAPWQVETIALNGVNWVASTRDFEGGLVRSARVSTAENQPPFANIGTLTIRRVSDQRVLHVIPPQWGTTQNEWFSVPAGWVASLRSITPYWSGDAQCRWRLREHTPQGTRMAEIGGALQIGNSGVQINLRGGHQIPGGSYFWFEVNRDPGGAGVGNILTVYADVEFYLGNDAALSL